jgi:hypothetical protein
MSTQEQSNKKILHDKVVLFVKNYIEENGGISLKDLENLFGYRGHQEIATTLINIIKIAF